MTPLASLLLDTFVTLIAVAALAVLVLYGVRRFGFGRPSGPLALVGRLPLDGRRTVYLVRVSSTVYILGASEAGLVKIGELPDSEIGGVLATESHGPFARVLAKALERKQPAGGEQRDREV
jgi:flagellar biogenesis protein FliO